MACRSTFNRRCIDQILSPSTNNAVVVVFEGYVPAQTRPYGYGINYLEIIIALALADAEFHWADSEVKRRRGRRCERERSFGLSCLLFQTSNPVRRLDGAGWDADER